MQLNFISAISRLCLVLLIVFNSSNTVALPFNANGNFDVQTQISASVEAVLNKSLATEQALEAQLANVVITNDAEAHLVAFAKGVVAHYREDHHSAIEYLLAAEQIAEKLPEKMTFQEPFYRFHIVLSDSYVALEDYGNGFLHKRAYLKKLGNQHDEKEKALLKSLEEKYQIDNKLKENELLQKSNELKKLEVERLEQLKISKERNVFTLILICIVFALMIVRQFKVRKKLLWIAEKDPLTRLANRATLFKCANAMTQKAQSQQQLLSIIMFDLDHFKKINDTHGHLTGDNALKLVADLGQEVMRSRDLLARLSGEEFVALLPGASIEEAKTIALRLKDKIEQSELYVKDRKVQLTASFGVACLNLCEPNFDALLKVADHALYQAKDKGRNQVVMATSSC